MSAQDAPFQLGTAIALYLNSLPSAERAVFREGLKHFIHDLRMYVAATYNAGELLQITLQLAPEDAEIVDIVVNSSKCGLDLLNEFSDHFNTVYIPPG